MRKQYLLIMNGEQQPGDLTIYTSMAYNSPCWPLHSVVEVDHFLKDAKALRLTPSERDEITSYMASHPVEGEEVVGTGGTRKVRFPGNGKGKLGGLRVLSFYTGQDLPVFLMRILSKNDKANLTQLERNALKAEVSRIIESYRGRE